ncbi:MAG: GC-type dockerin domain-anchored protein [Planctomycetota bacterium]
MRRRLAAIAGLVTAACATDTLAQHQTVFPDVAGDAVARPTDRGGRGTIHPDSALPDLLRVTASGWQPARPAFDPYEGVVVRGDEASIFRIQAIFDGLVNPPGTLGFAGQPFDPFRFGPSPVLGYIEFSVDGRKDTGGHLGSSAEQRTLANAARFGGRPEGSIGARAATSARDYDRDIFSGPQFERSGTDFALSLCGCEAVVLVREVGDGDGAFEAGESMLVRSRFFARAEGYIRPSGMRGGSVPGAYDPVVNLLFVHDMARDETAVTFVGPLTMLGAGLLAGAEPEPIDLRANNQWSIEEGVVDLVDSAPFAEGESHVLIEDWDGRDPEDSLDPTDWEAMAIVGTSYAEPGVDGLFVWSDVGFETRRGDLDGDALAGPLDRAMLRSWVYAVDGGVIDEDGTKNGRVVLADAPFDFSLFDLDASGIVEHEDLAAYGSRADLDGDGRLTIFDFLVFQNLFTAGSPVADFDLDEQLDLFDFLAFQNAFDGG